MLKRHATNLVAAAITAAVLGGCTAGEAPLETGPDFVPAPEVDAATIDPCAEQFIFQRELNGAPTDTATETSSTGGKTIIKESYWYADASMIVYFTYAEGEAWCNIWNESGVTWDN